MAKKPKEVDKGWSGITRSPEEDLALVSPGEDGRRMPLSRFVVILAVSAIILLVYLWMNNSFYPGLPMISRLADKNELVAAHYPPFRTDEWTTYSITQDIIGGRLFTPQSYSTVYPLGFSYVSVPFVILWNERGMFLTNVFLLWLSALLFFSVMSELVSFRVAVGLTLFMAFATPNIFYAVSAFPEPLGQFLLMLAVWLLVRGLSARRDWLFFWACGVAAGLTLFVQPHLAISVILFTGIVTYERGNRLPFDRQAVALLFGFGLAVLLFAMVNRFRGGIFNTFILSVQHCISSSGTSGIYGESGNFIAGLWRVLFDSPHGLLFLMPVMVLLPVGLLAMWRQDTKSMGLTAGVLIVTSVIITAMSACPVTGDSVGSRNLVPVIPFLVMPLGFLWQEHKGEKILLIVFGVLTVYMSTFGWWTGTVRGQGFFIGVLHDRDAQGVLLARSGNLDRPVFRSRNDLEAAYFDALGHGDITRWLQTLDPESIEGIHGVEREVFLDLSLRYHTMTLDRDRFIETIDPDRGIRPIIPQPGIMAKPDIPEGEVYKEE